MRDPLTISAQFAAFVWYTSQNVRPESDSALRFARKHWKTFLPVAQPGLGRLLLRIANRRPSRRRCQVAIGDGLIKRNRFG